MEKLKDYFNRNVNVNEVNNTYSNDNVNDGNNTDDNVNVDNYDIPDFKPCNEKEFLALETAEMFKDRKNLKYYIKTINRIGRQNFLKDRDTVKETPDEKIKKSRASFFAYLCKLKH